VIIGTGNNGAVSGHVVLLYVNIGASLCYFG